MPSHPASTIRIETLLEYEPFVRSILRGLVSDENQVQDLVQETWVRAMGRPPKESGAIKGWLARVAKNLVHDSRRRSATRTHRENAVSRPEADTSGATSEERIRLHQQIVDAVMELDEPYRSVMILTYYEDLSATQIAAKLDRKATTVRSQIHRAHEILRTKLDGDYGSRNHWMAIAVPMMQWKKPAAAKAAGLSMAQLASYAAIAVCTVTMGIWIGSLLSNPEQTAAEGNAGGEVAALHNAVQNAPSTGQNGLGDTEPDAGGVGGESGAGANNTALAGGSTDAQRALPLVEWTVRVTNAGKPEEGARILLGMDGDTQPSSDHGVHNTWRGYLAWDGSGLLEGRTGRDGRVTFQLPRAPVSVVALTDSGVAGAVVEDASQGGVQLEISPGFPTYVQVVDGAGELIDGVPIVMGKHEDPEGKPFDSAPDNLRYDLAWTLSESVKGRPLFYHEGVPGGPLVGGSEGRIQNFTVRLGITGLANEKVMVSGSLGGSIDKPIRLVKPATGSLNVKVKEADGSLSTRAGTVVIRKNTQRALEGDVESYCRVMDGVARFPMVGLGCEYTMTFYSPQTGVEWTAVGRGPAAPDTSTTCTIQGDVSTSFKGRLIGEAGPFEDWSKVHGLHFVVLDPLRKELQRVQFQAKADGSFQVSVDPKVVDNSEVSLQVIAYFRTIEGDRPRWDSEGLQSYEVADNNLGNLNVDWVQDRVWGQVVNGDGDPVADAHLSIQTDRWKHTSAVESDANGKFELKAVFADSTRLTVAEYRGGPEQVVEVDVGAGKPLRIVLESFAKLEGRLTAPRNADGNYYLVQVVHSDPEQRAEQPPTSRSEPDSGRYEVVGVRAGTHTVLVKLGMATILEIPSVRFEKGQTCPDPRVTDIDLSEHVSEWTFKILGPGGKPLQFVLCLAKGPDGQVGHAHTDRSGIARIALPKGREWTLEALKPGMRAGSLAFGGMSGDAPLVLQMEKGINVNLACQQDPDMVKDGQRIRLSLGLLDEDGEVIPNGPSVGLWRPEDGRLVRSVSFPEPGDYALMMSKENAEPAGGLVMVSSSTRCKFSDFVLEVKESDEGKTLDLVLPEDLFQDQ